MQTGQTYPQQPQQPQHTGTIASPGTEKQEYYSAGQQQAPMQQVQRAQAMPMPSQYQTATPLANLGEAAAPADCPCCRQRALTRVESHSGNTTQYVHSLLQASPPARVFRLANLSLRAVCGRSSSAPVAAWAAYPILSTVSRMLSTNAAIVVCC